VIIDFRSEDARVVRIIAAVIVGVVVLFGLTLGVLAAVLA